MTAGRWANVSAGDVWLAQFDWGGFLDQTSLTGEVFSFLYIIECTVACNCEAKPHSVFLSESSRECSEIVTQVSVTKSWDLGFQPCPWPRSCARRASKNNHGFASAVSHLCYRCPNFAWRLSMSSQSLIQANSSEMVGRCRFMLLWLWLDHHRIQFQSQIKRTHFFNRDVLSQ